MDALFTGCRRREWLLTPFTCDTLKPLVDKLHREPVYWHLPA